MVANYCPECGNELEPGAAFCSDCGTAIDDASDDATELSDATAQSSGAGVAEAGGDDSQSMFRVTSALIGGYFLFVIVGVGASIPSLAGVGVLCLVASLITMYLDLSSLDQKLWDTRPILWVIGAALLYIVVGPLYVYKRRQIA